MGFKFTRQYGIGKYIVDFYCPSKKLAIEIDGGQHNDLQNIEYDKERTAYLNSLGISVSIFCNSDIFNNVVIVCDEIVRKLEEIN